MWVFRIVLICILVWVSAYCGWYVYEAVFALLDFQIGIYKTWLQAWDQVGNVQDVVWWVLEKAMGLFGSDGLDTSPSLSLEERSALDIEHLESKVEQFEERLQLISGVIGVVCGLLVWKILSDIVFGFTTSAKRVIAFVKGA